MIGVSEFVVREYERACQIPVKTHLLKNAIDVARFNQSVPEEQKQSIRSRLGLSEQDFVILYVGRIMEIKGVLELMQAVIGLKDAHIKLMIMGSANSGKWAFSSYERKVKKLAAQNRDRIIFTGYVDNEEVYQYASVAHVQCLPTLVEEAAGLVLLEAMAGGLPLIVTKTGGVMEYVDSDTALLIERENVVEELQKAILYLKAHPEVRKQMSEKAKMESRKYSEAIYFENFVKIIDDIMENNRDEKNRDHYDQ